MKNPIILILFICLLSIVACSKDDNFSVGGSAGLAGDNEILAKVNGSPISRHDLDSALVRMLGDYQSSLLDPKGRRNALESLVMSRAMAQTVKKELSRKDLAIIEKQVTAHREKLLVNHFLRKHSTVAPVTDKMVKAFYEKNTQRFGARTERQYEMLFSANKVSADERDKIIAALGGADKNKQWKKMSKRLAKAGIKLQYRQGKTDEKLLHPRLQALLKSIKVGTTSNVSFIDGKPYLVRITAENQIAPRPLNEVSAKIRKSLMPLQLKQAIEKSSAELLPKMKIKYFDKTVLTKK